MSLRCMLGVATAGQLPANTSESRAPPGSAGFPYMHISKWRRCIYTHARSRQTSASKCQFGSTSFRLYTVTRCILGFHGWGVEIASCRFKIQDHARCRCGAHHQPPLRSIKSADAGFDADPFTNLWAVAASCENSRAIEGWSKCNAHGAGELSRFFLLPDIP